MPCPGEQSPSKQQQRGARCNERRQRGVASQRLAQTARNLERQQRAAQVTELALEPQALRGDLRRQRVAVAAQRAGRGNHCRRSRSVPSSSRLALNSRGFARVLRTSATALATPSAANTAATVPAATSR